MKRLVLVWSACAAVACVPKSAAVRTSAPPLTAEEAVALVPEKVPERAAWAADVVRALEGHRLPGDAPAVCAVMAVIEQESGFDADPAVPGLPKMVLARLAEKVEKLGPLGGPALKALLDQRAPGTTRSFEERIPLLKTERDVDRWFRELLAYYRGQHPATLFAADVVSELLSAKGLDALNPVTTAGSMQVSVRFAERVAKERGFPVENVREQLYTREGGVYYGALRLLGYPANYEDPVYRFADYNAGVYASRNASLQAQLTELTGRPLATDGDFLAYDARAEPLDVDTQSLRATLAFRERYAPQLTEGRIRKDLLREKELAFEQTETYRAIRRAYVEKKKVAAPYAQIPAVTLQSPKLTRERTTGWFARSVEQRYRRCLERAAAARLLR